MILTGDVNLMNVDDPAVPFARVREEFRAADIVFSNLECCLYDPPARPCGGARRLLRFIPDRRRGTARCRHRRGRHRQQRELWRRRDHCLDRRLDALGIPHTGAGANVAAARAPAIVERDGVRYGFLQRSSVYWPTNHEAGANSTGIAVIRAHTAYQVPMHKTRPEIPPMNRPGIPPVIITWADPDYLRAFTEDIAALRAQADIVVASCHWGLHKEVLAYMREIGHAAIDAGADIVIGHGPHYSLPVEVYRGKPIFYGLGSFSFHTGHGGRAHGDWIGMMVRATIADRAISGRQLSVRSSQRTERDGDVPPGRGSCRTRRHSNPQRALWDTARSSAATKW